MIIAMASIFGLITLAWPLLVRQPDAHLVQPPWIFMLLLPIVVIIVVAEISEDGLDARALAILGVLSAVDAVLRGLSAGIAGVEFVFFLIILGGRVFGPAFGFVLGCSGLFASALLTAGVGPWLPYQMLCSAWIGLGAGLLPAARGRAEIAILVAYGVAVSLLYGLLLNLQGWPMLAGISIPGHEEQLAFDPSADVLTNLATFVRYTLITSTTSYDLIRAVTTAVAIVVLGPAVLSTLRRTARRATVIGVLAPTTESNPMGAATPGATRAR
jgi:energy-coupling factor transport system substrate-specific component